MKQALAGGRTNRKILVVLLTSVPLLLTAFIVIWPTPSYVNVSNLELKYDFSYQPQHSNVPQVLDATIRNNYTSDLITQSVAIDGKNYCEVYFLVPQGQTRNITFTLLNLSLASNRPYRVQLNLKFADGKHASFSDTYTTPQFKGQIQVVNTSLNFPSANDNSSVSQFFRAEGVSVLDVTILNSGNLPITALEFNFDNESYELNGINFPLLPEETTTGWAWLWLNATTKVFMNGTAYPFSIQTSYADGNMSTTQDFLLALSD